MSKNMDTIKIMITDDHPVLREGLAGMLAGQPDFEVIGLAANGEVAVESVYIATA